MRKKFKLFTSIIAASTIISSCGIDTSINSNQNASNLITPVEKVSSNESSSESSSSATESTSVQASNDAASTESASSASTASTTDFWTDDPSVPTVVFLGDDQFNLGRNDDTSIAHYVETMLSTKAHVINLGCEGVTASTSLNNTNDTSMNFVNVAKFLNGQMSDSFFDNFPDAKEEAFSFDPADVDYYVVEYGINDFLQAKALFSSDYPSDTTYYVNAITNGLQLLCEASPDAKIILCSPVYSAFYASDGSFSGSGHTYSNTFGSYLDYCAGCIHAGSDFDCIAFDAFGDAYMNVNDQTISEYMEDDGIHLTRAGRNTFAAVVAHMINKQLGYDNSEIEYAYDIEDYMLETEK